VIGGIALPNDANVGLHAEASLSRSETRDSILKAGIPREKPEFLIQKTEFPARKLEFLRRKASISGCRPRFHTGKSSFAAEKVELLGRKPSFSPENRAFAL
jgi:hypothetical protein